MDDGDDRQEEASIVTPGVRTLDDKCLQAQQQIKLYQSRISKAFNKKVRG